MGCGKSNVGKKCLVACPTNIYITVKDTLVQINATYRITLDACTALSIIAIGRYITETLQTSRL